MACASSADVKMVSRLTMKSNMAAVQQLPQTVTTYFRKGLVRSDMGNDTTIVNEKTHQTIVIDNAAKTYHVVSMTAGQNQEMMKNMKFAVSGKVTPSNKTKKLLGRPARLYSADFKITFTSPMLGNVPQTMNVHMDQWTSTAVHTPVSTAQMMQVVSKMFQGMPGMTGMDKMTKELAKMKGFPLDSQGSMKMTFKMPQGQPTQQGVPTSIDITFNNTVMSLKETSLSDSLFKVPAGYRKLASGPGGPGLGH